MIRQIELGDETRGLTSLVKPRDGVAFQGLDVTGAVREVADPATAQDGTRDTTRYADAAAVTLTVRMYGQFRGLLDELGQYCVPWARPYLKITDDEWAGDRLLRLRYDSQHAALTLGTGLTRVVGYQWKVPAGTWEAADAAEYVIPARAVPVAGLPVTAAAGVSVGAAAGLHVPASDQMADSLIAVAGNMPAPWRAKLYGPCTGPALYRDDTGQGLVFTDALVLAAGEYVELDSAARTALFYSDPDASRLRYLDYGASSWFDLEPGTCLVRYAPDAVSPGAACDLVFTPRWMP